MPLYDYSCSKCGREWEASNKVSERYSEVCCSSEANIVISPTRTKPVILEGYNVGIGEYITGPKQKREMMKKHKLEEAG